ncbi:MAG: UDP-N-acetylglucosamine 2-epimerase (non-hydrolyzing) [Solirubrobacterales bacterium]|nr:UDP-N-acetylglucosamine 2-epimerase (non-hydrolyzing) [Solirubrobacterales bacterium]
MRVMTVLGTRPELIRLCLVFERFAEGGVEHHLVHTGQNYDERLSDIFFGELGIPEPDAYLGVRAVNVGEQIGQIVERSERELLAFEPDALLVLGDTNSGLAAIAAARHGIPVFHMEAGNRCFDERVPEEKNRRLIDHISDWLLPYTPRSREYLLAEGLHPTRVMVSGNPIADVLERFRPTWEASDVLDRLGLAEGGYVLVTAHRQETVDVPERLEVICRGLGLVAAELDLPVVWSVHPRTRGRLADRTEPLDDRIQLHEPFGFADFVRLEAGARLVISDSGTVQEECSLLKVPAVTCRDTTERPETVECGSNVLSGVADPRRMLDCARAMLTAEPAWESPYEGELHRGVADKVAKFIVSQAGR